MKKYLECGKIVSTHGLRGEVKVQPWCDGPEYLCGFSTLYFKEGQEPVKVEQARTHKNMAILKLKGWDSIDEAVTLRGRILYIDREDDPDEDSVFIQDLLGITVKDVDSGQVYGKLTDVLPTGANDVYAVTGERGERLIPAIPQVVLSIDLEKGIMEIRPLKGLFDDED